MSRSTFFTLSALLLVAADATAGNAPDPIIAPTTEEHTMMVEVQVADIYEADIDTTAIARLKPFHSKGRVPDIYDLPYSFTGRAENWHRLWINTAIYSGAFAGTLLVLECLPEDATTWNRASLQQTPPEKRWFRNVFKRGPEWDHDRFIFNYVLHPYAGAVYFMAARSCGFNFWGSLLYATCISNVGWEFGIEACMERPSIQDLFITPLVGSAIGELFYKLKRNIVGNGYRLFGSPFLGSVVAFIIDPVDEVVGLFRHDSTRKMHTGSRRTGATSSLMPYVAPGSAGFAFTCTF